MRQSIVNLGIARGGPSGLGRRLALGGAPKRFLDIAVGVVALVLAAPLLIVTAMLVRSLFGAPVFRVERAIGLGGKQFNRYLFRTSIIGANPRGNREVEDVDQEVWTEFLGSFLRRSDLDKLPLLVNVVLGDMSFIGPQAIAPLEAQTLLSEAPEVLLARPGLIGPRTARYWRSNGNADPSLDGYYVRHWSMWLDLKIAWGAFARLRAEESIIPPR
ncbi:MAG TPA: sugar transferase [Hyphomicrobiaceae bacterium]|nr:sugar transferase [Hyphomicrobiaceae bacterium]